MMKCFCRYGLVAAVAIATWGFKPIQKKLIAHGWDLLAVTPEEVLAHADAFDQTAIDGVTLMIREKLADGRAISHTRVMTDPPWPRELLKGKIETFREIVKHPSLRESFISSWWAPQKRLDWRDDAAWANFATNMATVAWLAKEGGLRGILVDAEDYPKTDQYHLKPEDSSYDETARLARRRGAEVFRAIFKEFPDVTFLSFWMLSLNPSYFGAVDPLGAARAHGALWPWFVNGMLDVMPDTASFVDGNEHAYRYEAEQGDFYRSASLQHTAALDLIAPENRSKYRAHLRAGFGLYLDSYINPTNSSWYFGPVDGSRTTHLGLNLQQAVKAADEYVWVYGEKRSWIPWKGTQNKRFVGVETWDGALPGFTATLLGAKDPLAYLNRRTEQLRAAGALSNLVKTVKWPWGVWQDPKKLKGKLGRSENGEVWAEGVGGGCHLVHLDVLPGEVYGVHARIRGIGGSAIVYWQKDGRWQWHVQGVPLASGEAENGEIPVQALVRVPPKVNRLVLELNAHQQAGERVTFSKVEIHKLISQ